MDDDQPALQAVRAGDETALVELMDRYREPVFRLACRFVGNPVDAANLAEEVFVQVYFNAHRYRPRGTVKSWIFAIARNRCRDFLRREKRRRATLSLSVPTEEGAGALEATVPGDEPNAAVAAERREQLERLHRAIRNLPEKLRFPFVFCILEGHSQEEAAEVLGTTRKTVESRIYRARLELRRQMEE